MLMLLAGILEAAHTFVQRAAQLAAQEGASSSPSLPAAVYPPFQPQLDRSDTFACVLEATLKTIYVSFGLHFTSMAECSSAPSAQPSKAGSQL